MAVLGSTPTSPAKIFNSGRARARAGFTLIEIMVVLAIIAVALTVALPRLFKTQNNVKSVARHFLVLGKETRNRARLQNVTMRLVIDMDPAAPKYWVEKSRGPMLIDPEADREERKKESEKEEKQPDWEIDKVLTKKPEPLPDGLYFASVETINMNAPQTDGVAYIHFFPQGLMEAAALQVTDRKSLNWTLIYNPLTGQADIIDRARSLKEVNR